MSHAVTAGKYLAAAILTASVTLGLATLLGGASRELSQRVDRNAEVTKDGTASVVCILSINPDDRTDQAIRACLAINGYITEVRLPPKVEEP